ncbi:hypothetical protein KP509_16G014900 [Ceratopteris richardii]|uniref:Uncharacterized protein n=1 Tax=Ceratopteris richardii TaxID=49495 RepID=A0A8T2SXP7_CERRI|nr:hypothetical protein KP509_16G014900 [Ceratopteris richardii]
MQRIASAKYTIPDFIRISKQCNDLLSKIFVADAGKRITVAGIKKHSWFLKNLPKDLKDALPTDHDDETHDVQQSVEDIMQILDEAKNSEPVATSSLDEAATDADETELDSEIGSGGELLCAV